MNFRTPFVTAALLAAVTLAGCGDDNKAETQGGDAPAASTAIKQSPEEAWANKVCVRLSEQAKQLQPPNVEPTKPAASKAELIRFFDQVADQLDSQIAEFKTIGAPPTAAQTKVWEAAQDDLKGTLKKVEAIRRGIRSESFETEADVTAGVAQLGKDFKVLSAYLGPVDGLSKDPDLKAAFTADPACVKVS